jgi:hypothetical protein
VIHGDITIGYGDQDKRLPISRGDVVRLDVSSGGKWLEVVRMRLYKPSEDPAGKTITWEAHDDGYLLQLSRDDFHFRRGKHRRRRGWRAHEIAAAVAKQYRIPLGRVAEAKHYIKRLDMTNSSPMQVLQRAYALEKDHTGRRFVIQFNRGKIDILPLARNPMLYGMGPMLTAATIADDTDDGRWATAVTVRGSHKKGKKVHKIETEYIDKPRVRKYGFIHKIVRDTAVDSDTEARARAKRYIAKHSEVTQTVEMTGPGIPFIRRGNAMKVAIPRVALEDQDGILFVTSHEHTLSGGDFTMTLAMGFSDPYIPAKKKRQAKDAKTRAAKRKKK